MLRERLWTSGLSQVPSFSIRADSQIFGRGFEPKEFSKFLDSFLGESGDFSLDRSQAREFIVQIVETTDERIRHFELNLECGERSKSRSAFYAELKSTPENRRALRLILHTCLKGTPATATFQRKDSDEILNYFGQLKQNPSCVLGDCGIVSFDGGFWPSLIQSALPGLPELLRLHKVFPPATRPTRRGRTITREHFKAYKYDFTPASRGLHKVWRGITYNDCIGGNPDHLDQLMPERWACPLLEGAIFCNITRAGMIEGYVQLVPFEYGGDRYASIDTQWSPFFNLTEGGDLVFVRHLEKIRGLLPRDWKGIVVGRHPAGRDPYETDILQTLDCYKKGQVLGTPKRVHFGDALATQIVQASERRGYGAKFRPNYGSRMLTDASLMGEEAPLVILNFE